MPFEELPHVYDPPEHFIVTANHRPAGRYPYVIGSSVRNRIGRAHYRTACRSGDSHAGRFRAHPGRHGLAARQSAAAAFARARPPREADRQAVEMLRDWNFDAPGNSAAPIFQAWFLRLAPTMAGDELRSASLESYAGRFIFVTRFLVTAPSPARSRGATTSGPQRPKRADAVTTALHEAVADLGRGWGPTGRAGDGTRCITRCFRTRASTRWAAAAAAQPIDAERRRLEHGERRVRLGRCSPYEQRAVARLPANRRPLARQRQPLLDAVGQSGTSCRRTTTTILADWQAVRTAPGRCAPKGPRSKPARSATCGCRRVRQQPPRALALWTTRSAPRRTRRAWTEQRKAGSQEGRPAGRQEVKRTCSAPEIAGSVSLRPQR